jgi:V/A-type H+/Na+-transporting ATPase subunit E
MSLEVILASIESSGEAEIDRLRSEAESRAQQILEAAERKAAIVREEARRAALWPAAAERARRLHQAKLEALRTVGEIRNQLIETTLSETRRHLVDLRADPDYPLILRRLIAEAVDALGEAELHNGRVVLEIDPQDERLIRHILDDLGVDLQVVSSLHGWGGIVVTSSDRRVVVNNTLESRLERATPFLRQDLAAFLEKGGETSG